MNPHQLISLPLCPFAQTVAVVLEARALPYRWVRIEREAKPTWFLDVSPLGKVPVLVSPEGSSYFESHAIAELLNEAFAGEPLLPGAADKRAQARGWISVFSSLNFDLSALRNAATLEKVESLRKQIEAKLERIESAFHGPWFAGSAFSLVDAAAAPSLARLHWLSPYFEGPTPMDRCPRLRDWTERLLRREDVARSFESETPRAQYLSYVSTTEVSWIGKRIPV